MDFGLSETQEMLRNSLRDFLRAQVASARVREVMEAESGHEPKLLAELAELGVTLTPSITPPPEEKP